MIRELDPATRAIADVAAVVDGSEDYAWDPATPGALYMARGSKLMTFTGGIWKESADFAVGHVGNITRIALNPRGVNQIALVGEPR